MKRDEFDCPPSEYDDVCPKPAPVTILDYAALANDAANRWQQAMDARVDYRTMMSASGKLARATQALATAIADSVACGDNRLS